jgi:transposase
VVVRNAVVRRSELTDGAWERIAPLLPENGRRGKQWKDHRTVVNGILRKLRTGAPWRDLSERYGSWQTCSEPASSVGGARGGGTGSWPERRRSPSRWARSSGRSASTALLPERIGTRPAPAAGRDAKTQKGGRVPRGRGAWAQPRRVEHEGASGLRREGAPALGGRDAGPATREHATRGRARRHPGGASGCREATQAS